jgi:hypothetical protein
MDPTTRWILALVFVALVVWRLAHYLRLAMSSTHRQTLGAAGGSFAAAPAEGTGAAVPAEAAGSLLGRSAGLLVSASTWLVANALLWFILLGLPPLNYLPPIPLGVAGIFANFYIIPFAGKVGRRAQKRIDQARVVI